jgi:hypothetical protein
MSDYYESVASDSSVFDGNDSAAASSLDLSLDANGQPIFDNISASAENNDDVSNEIPVVKPKLKRQGVKKKSGFRTNEIKKNSIGSEYSGSEDGA